MFWRNWTKWSVKFSISTFSASTDSHQGGHLKPDPYIRAAKALAEHGKDAAEEVASFESRNLSAVGEFVKREGIDCDFVRTRASDVFLYGSGRDDLVKKVAKLTEAGISTIDDVDFSSDERAEAVS